MKKKVFRELRSLIEEKEKELEKIISEEAEQVKPKKKSSKKGDK